MLTGERVVDLNGNVDESDDAIITLRMLMDLHGETHALWRITRSKGGAWDYVKLYKVPKSRMGEVQQIS